MKRMIDLFVAMYKDVHGLSGANTSEKDILYLTHRVKREGMSFLTITLPTIGDALLMGLESGWWPLTDVTSFGRHKGRALPRFLSGLLRLVFDEVTGELLPNANVTAIWGVHQLSSSFKKIELECSPERVSNAYRKYLTTDSEVRAVRMVPKNDYRNLRRVFEDLFSSALLRVERAIYERELAPKYSSGAVAEGFKENQKFSAPYYSRLEPIFPPEVYVVPNLNGNNELSGREFVPIGHEKPAKVTHVPKTLKTPRLIAMEPTSIQYAQQGLMAQLYDELLASAIGSSLNFRDQSVNGKRALEGSKDGSLATLDLSEASDRVGSGMVSFLFKNFPLTREFLFRARSSRASLPDGTTIRLRKFASMGSAMCFPIEAMVFLAIATLGVIQADRKNWTKNAVKRAASRITVFGDDIIVPRRYALSTALALGHFGLKVNSEKSFSKGLFRESCGVDAYQGYVITPVRIRTLLPTSVRDTRSVISSVSLCNHLFENGLWRASDFVRREVEKSIRMKLPHVLSTSPGLGLSHSWSQYYDTHRVCKNLQRPEVRTLKLVNSSGVRNMGGTEATIKALLRLREPWGDSGSREAVASRLPDVPGEVHPVQAESIPGTYKAFKRLVQFRYASSSLPLDSELRRHSVRLHCGWAPSY